MDFTKFHTIDDIANPSEVNPLTIELSDYGVTNHELNEDIQAHQTQQLDDNIRTTIATNNKKLKLGIMMVILILLISIIPVVIFFGSPDNIVDDCCMVGGSLCAKDGSKCPFDYNKILVAGRYTIAEIATIKNFQNENCKLKEYFPPHDRWSLAYGVLEGVPLLCGGSNVKNKEIYQDCVAIGHPDLKIQMLEKREWTSGIVLNYPEKTLWITGGLSELHSGKGHSSSEFIYLNKPAEKGPYLPFEIHKHCMIKYNDSAVFIIGGDLDKFDLYTAYTNPSSKTWIIDPTNNFAIRVGPSLSVSKMDMTCGKMTIDGKTWLVVGPYNPTEKQLDLLDPLNVNQGWLKEFHNSYQNSSILSLATTSLRKTPVGLTLVFMAFKTGVISGPEIPCSGDNFGGAFVPTTQGLLYTGSQCDENLYELRGNSIQSLQWFKLNEKLSNHPGYLPAAFPLPNELEVTCA